MKKNYNNNNGRKDRYQKDNNGRDGREGRDGRDNNNGRERRSYNNEKKTYSSNTSETVKNSNFTKNPLGFLVISLFINAKTSMENIVNSIQSAIEVDVKKKIVISFEDNTDKSKISSIRKKFEGAFGVFFYNQKAKMCSSSSVNSSLIHTEVLKAFKSNFFLTLDSNVSIRPFSVEKMILFLSKPGDVLAISPKFYDENQAIIYGCKRFFSMGDFFFCSETKKKEKMNEHFMMERGEVGYYSIHRIDYGNLDCMLFLTDALLKVKSFPIFKNQDLRDATLCNKFSKKTKGKIMFYPHGRVVSASEKDSTPSMFEKIKYLVKKAF